MRNKNLTYDCEQQAHYAAVAIADVTASNRRFGLNMVKLYSDEIRYYIDGITTS